MSSSLPYDTAVEKTVQQFGIGPYDSDEDGEHGEDSNKREPKGKSLPDGGGGSIDLPETMLSYPTSPTTFASVRYDDPFALWLVRASLGSAELPGDADVPPRGHKKDTVQQTVNDTVPTVSQSKLPNDADNPSARSDYYDRMRQGLERAPDPKSSSLWADEDSGAYASESLPTPGKNEVERDNSLGALGNAWSGRTVEDSSNEEGFPSTDYSENVDFDRSDLDGGGRVMASVQHRVSTSIALVQELTAAFIKKCGKKDLIRRHVMAFLKEAGKSSYFASDVIRCLKLSHGVYVKDVLDEFPVVKTASGGPSIASTRDKLVDLEILHMSEVDTAKELRRCAAALSDVVAVTDRMAADPTKDYDDYAPAGGHAEDNSAHEAYKDYLEDYSGDGEPVSFEEFLEGKH
jgi:hypothetical protein